ncbi:hypothetical protein ABW16_01915 [Mycolicibacter heraklionensis]|uniref:Integrase n=1 Tax=Mycolicibacter heraklionensis TaxID=512402 RepID=A0ABR5FKP4_9MYCO|nr:hypothetical protein [Mycolicibacter heraklionensis]KLO31607.1 hypothetical protein ABW16_01915 [Mycolicibacter heraklionensis]
MTKRSPRQLEASRRNIRIAMAARIEKAGAFQDRADCFEAGLAAGIPVSAALADGGWTNVEAANRAYKRHRRPQPTALRAAYNEWQNDQAKARRRRGCSR